MSDKSTQAVVSALEKALAEPTGLPLHAARGEPGLFAPTPLGRQAAQRCVDDGHLHVVRTEARGKSSLAICKLTDKGLAYLLSQLSPRQVLDDLIRAVEARQGQAQELLQLSRQLLTSLDGLKATAQKVLVDLQHGRGPAPRPVMPWTSHLLSVLDRWALASAGEDCPLPELYRQLRMGSTELTIGQFHDGLRELHDTAQVGLQLWTAPLYDMPEPRFALLVGHGIAYYASRR